MSKSYPETVIAVVQRVLRASVKVEGSAVGQIGHGILALVAAERGDGEAEAAWMAGKLAGLRIFPDASGGRPYDRDVRQVDGGLLLVSNFTVAASCARGRRPSLDAAAAPEAAQGLLILLAELLRSEGVRVETGKFGADMEVELVNDGPVTLIVQTPR